MRPDELLVVHHDDRRGGARDPRVAGAGRSPPSTGTAAGAGSVLALASDFRVMARSAKFAFLFTKVGLAGADMGAAYLLPRLVGLGRATKLLMLGDTLGAERGRRLGTGVASWSTTMQVDATPPALATRLASGPWQGYSATKRLLSRELDMSLLGRRRARGDDAGAADEGRRLPRSSTPRSPGSARPSGPGTDVAETRFELTDEQHAHRRGSARSREDRLLPSYDGVRPVQVNRELVKELGSSACWPALPGLDGPAAGAGQRRPRPSTSACSARRWPPVDRGRDGARAAGARRLPDRAGRHTRAGRALGAGRGARRRGRRRTR